MNRKVRLIVGMGLILSTAASGLAQTPAGTAFTYQGQLKHTGLPVNSTADFQFSLWDDAATPPGTQVGPTLSVNNVTVTNGLFTVTLDFGAGIFTGSARWLQVAVRSPAGSGSYTQLSPLQEVTPLPYALNALAPWVKSGDDLYYNAGNVGIGTGSPTHALEATTATAGAVVDVTNTKADGSGDGLKVVTYGPGSQAIYGYDFGYTGQGKGVFGASNSTSGTGVTGWASAAYGFTYGVIGESDSAAGVGVFGLASAGSGTNYAFYGEADSPDGYAGYFVGRGYFSGHLGVGTPTPTSALTVNGTVESTGSSGGFKFPDGTVQTTAAGGGGGLGGSGTQNHVAKFTNATTLGDSAIVENNGNVGIGTSGPTGPLHVEDTRNTDGARAIYGRAGSSGGAARLAGVFGETCSTASGSNRGAGVWGLASAASGAANGVYGETAAPAGAGVYGNATSTAGTNTGVLGVAAGPFSYGVWGEATLSAYGTGVHAIGSEYGVYAQATSGYAVYCYGNLAVTGTKAFQIDHPLDPANKYLNHYCAEGPEPLLIYRGNATLDASGEAVVTLPDYFEAINRDLQYQLTCIGRYAPVYVAEEVAGNRFRIAGGSPGLKVSWTVTGVRNDVYVRAHPPQVAVDKGAEQRGLYLHPVEWGQPESKGIDYARRQAARGIREALPEPKQAGDPNMTPASPANKVATP